MLSNDNFEMIVCTSWQGLDLLRGVAWIRNCEQSLDFAFLLLHVSTVLEGDSPLGTIWLDLNLAHTMPDPVR